ncbi:hypothetical protein CQW23_15110 [Capsicum baccatum]|uniref:KIB1-4 beta-propeller domain-containing protein n=1 Tax=Capsicum baccatum TaxID=33114 RepID=A0A2G2WL47_CAPBA|nr:hypothetical protein CQW23_15110 [Capsicum baccatum]
MTYSSTIVPSSGPTSMQLPWLMLAPENAVSRFCSLWEKDVKEVVVVQAMNTSQFHESLENRPLLTFSLKRLPLHSRIDPDRITHKTMNFNFFKVDFINDHLMNLQYLKDSIGNHAFFVGKKWSFVLSTTEFPELKFYSIYFADDHYDWEHNFGGHDMGIYDYKEDNIIDKIESISPANSWFIPDVDAPDVHANF